MNDASIAAPAAVAQHAPLVAETLGGFAAGLRFADIPNEVVRRAKHLALDAVGIALASTGFEFARRTLDAAVELANDSGDLPVIGTTRRLPWRDAAMVNGVFVHGLDYDDTHTGGVVHATASLFPTVLAVGARLGASGQEAIAAYVAGIEAAARLGAVARGGFHQIGFHPTGLVGVFGCALAAGRLLGLSEREVVMAQGIALSQAAGSLEFLEDGAWTKRLHPGWAAASGITAAVLARHGFVGPTRVYEGRFGLFASHLQERFRRADLALATVGLGATWELLQVAVKPFPACHFTHACADAAIALVGGQGLDPRSVRRVRALVPEEVVKTVCEPVANKRRPANAYDAQFSIPYIVAASLLRGRFTLAELDEAALADPEILALADRVEYEVDPLSSFPRHYSGALVVECADGREVSHREQVNRGCGDRPLAEAEIVAKYRDNAARAVPPAKAAAIEAAILGWDAAPDMRRFAEILAAG